MTKDRLIIQSGLIKIKVQSIHLKSIVHMDIDEGLDGSGTIPWAFERWYFFYVRLRLDASS